MVTTWVRSKIIIHLFLLIDLNNGDGLIPNDMNAPSPIHMESPGSPLMNLVPPNSAPFLPPPPFIGAPPMSLPFMPPPPLVPIPGEMRPPPLGIYFSPQSNNIAWIMLKLNFNMAFRSINVTATTAATIA